MAHAADMAAAADWLANDLFGLILRLNMDALSWGEQPSQEKLLALQQQQLELRSLTRAIKVFDNLCTTHTESKIISKCWWWWWW